MKKNRLTQIKVDEISLVKRGDDPTARIILAKTESNEADDNKIGSTQETDSLWKDEDMSDEQVDEYELPQEVMDYIESLESFISEELPAAKAEGNDDAGEAESDTDESVTPTAEETKPETEPEGAAEEAVANEGDTVSEESGELVLAGLSKTAPALAAHIEALEKRAAAAEKVATNEQSIRKNAEAIAKASKLNHIGEAGELADIFKSIDAVDPAIAGRVYELLTAANEQLDTSKLFEEVGKTSAIEITGLDDKVAALSKSNSDLTAEQAYADALAANPGLYDQMLAEQGVR